jgi:hypothetical protein
VGRIETAPPTDLTIGDGTSAELFEIQLDFSAFDG